MLRGDAIIGRAARWLALLTLVLGLTGFHASGARGQDPATQSFLELNAKPSVERARALFDNGQTAGYSVGLDSLKGPIYAIEEGALVEINLGEGQATRTSTRLAALPEGEGEARLALLKGQVLLVGTRVHRLAKAGTWDALSDVPAAALPLAGLGVAGDFLYLAGQGAAFRFDPRDANWRKIAAPPPMAGAASGFALGSAHIGFAGADPEGARLLLYHTVTDRWFFTSATALPAAPTLVLAKGEAFEVIGAETTLTGKVVLADSRFSYLDYGVVAALAAVLIGIGLWSSSRSKQSSGEFFRGGGSVPWWAASLSIFATGSSAITVMSMPAMAFTGNWIYFSIGLFLIVIMVPLFTFVYVPILRRLNMASANEYLEHRYSLSVRMLGFASFSLYQILGRVAAILLLPAIAINSILGIPITTSILLMGLLTTFVVAIGGFAAVIWTDVVLAVLIILAVGVSVYFALDSLEMAPAEAWALLEAQDKLQLFDWRLDWGAPVVTVLFFNSLATAMGYAGDQNFLQRVQCTPTQKGAVSAAVGQLFVAVPLNFVLFSLGTLLFLFYYTRPDLLSPAMKPDGIYPYFAANSLPAGVGGLVAVALLAATVSTVSSALNSVSNLGVEDIYRRFRPDVSDASCVRLGRWLTIGLGVFGTAMALLLANLSALQSVWDLFLMVMGLIVGPVTGIFVLGIFTRSANTPGIWIGTVASLIANALAINFLQLHSTAFLSIGVFTCLVVGYVASFAFAGSSQRDISGLTIFSSERASAAREVF